MTDEREPVTVADFTESDFIQVKGIPNFIQMNTMPVVHVRDGEFRPLGTCFAITNDGLLVTARHVIEEAYPLVCSPKGGDMTAEGQIYAVYTSAKINREQPESFMGGLLPVSHLFGDSLLDIGLMKATLPIENDTGKTVRMPSVALSPGIPKVGQRCMAFGYHAMSWRPLEELKVSVEQTFSASRGVIEEVHYPRRDSAMLPFPCFRVSARYEGGMSGGPVISETGQVCGVVCSSMGRGDTPEGYTSYASLVGPALVLQLTGRDADGSEWTRFLYEFVDGGAVAADKTYSDLRVARNDLAVEIDFGDGRTIKNVLK